MLPIRNCINIRDVTGALEQFYRSSLFIALLLLTVLYLLSGSCSLVLCNVLCILPPGIFTYFQIANINEIVQESLITYWIICGIFFACDTICAGVNGYPYIKMVSLTSLFYYVAQLSIANTNSKKWAINRRDGCTYASGDTTVSTSGCRGTTLNTLTTVPREGFNKTFGRSTVKLGQTKYSSARQRSLQTGISDSANEKVGIKTALQNLTLATAVSTTLTEYTPDTVEELITYPESEIIMRSDRNGPVTVAFTNNYKKPVFWALKTNAIRRLVAFPNFGIIPPSQTVQVKIDLVEKMPKKRSKDRLSLEYIVSEQRKASDNDYYSFFYHDPDLTRMKKNLKVVYVR